MARDLLTAHPQPSGTAAPASGPALIELRGVGRHYRLGDIDVPALDGVSLAIRAGEFVAVIGQSGSGKSTLMNVLGCLDNPTAGQFLIDGQDASHFGADELAALRRERFGFIFQRYHLLPHLDARGNAALPAVYAGASASQRASRAQQLLERLGLGDRMHHKPNELSGGQQQRVSIARSLMNGGQIILADEPTGALDSASGAEMLKLLRELNERGHTIILVTHDHQVAAHARRVIELRDGKVLKDSGTPPDYQAPQTAFEETHALPASSWWSRLQGQWREALQSAVQSLQVRGRVRIGRQGMRLEARATLGDVQGAALAQRVRELQGNTRKMAARQVAQQMFAGFRVEAAAFAEDGPVGALTLDATLLRSGAQQDGDEFVATLPIPADKLVASFGDRGERTQPFRFPGDIANDWELEITFDDGLRPRELPGATSLVHGPLHYLQELRWNGSQLLLRRRMAMHPATVPAAQFAEWMRALLQVDRSQQATLRLWAEAGR